MLFLEEVVDIVIGGGTHINVVYASDGSALSICWAILAMVSVFGELPASL